jgi:hypothetical protein
MFKPGSRRSKETALQGFAEGNPDECPYMAFHDYQRRIVVTFIEMIRLVLSSETCDWEVLGISSERENDHSSRAVFKPELSISLCWGRRHGDTFEEEWTTKFIGKEAVTEYAELFFNGGLVFRELYVCVDAGKGILPMPKLSDHAVPAQQLRFASLLHGLSGLNADGWRFENYVQMSGIKESNEPWHHL